MMPILRIRIEPKFCGPASVDTISPIKILRRELGIGLAEAKEHIDRCVFGGEVATRIATKLNATPPPAKIEAQVLDESSSA